MGRRCAKVEQQLKSLKLTVRNAPLEQQPVADLRCISCLVPAREFVLVGTRLLIGPEPVVTGDGLRKARREACQQLLDDVDRAMAPAGAADRDASGSRGWSLGIP